MKLRAPLAALVAAVSTLGCPSEGGVSNVLVVAVVEVAPDIREIVQGETLQLSATPKTASGITVTGRTTSWSSTDPQVATVSSSGLVTGVNVGGPVRIRATVDGITGDAVITVRPVPVNSVAVDPQELNLLRGASRQFAATAFDANGNQLSGRTFFWESTDHTTATVTTNGLVIGIRQGGPVTISATAEGKIGTGSVFVSDRPADRLGFLSQPPLNAIAGQPLAPIQIAVQDNLLVTVSGATNPVTIALADNPGGGTLSGTTTRNAVDGIATFDDLVLDRAASGYRLRVTSIGLTPAISNSFTLSPGSASQGSFTTAPPSAAQSGLALNPQPVIQLRDGSGNPVSQSGVTITAGVNQVSAIRDSASAAPSAAAAPEDTLAAVASVGGNTSAVTNAQGVATFTDLLITGTVGSYTLSFSAAGMATLTSLPIALGPGPAAGLFISTQPSPAAQSNVPLPVQPAIQLRDASGNDVPQGGVTVTAAIASGPAGGAVGGNASAVTSPAGLATFSGLSISGPAGTYTLRFTATGLGSATSNSIVVGAGG
ncbi:MAG: Ig-like domain-containing protein, partial [Gemmatimonadales bacterium]